MLKRFISYYKPHMKLFIADLVAAVLLAAADLFFPKITQNMLADYIPNRNLRLLLIWAAVLLVVYLIKMGLNYFVQYQGHMVGIRMQADMRRDMFDHLQKLPLTFFDNNKTGSLMSRMISDLQDISELAHHGPEDLLISVILFIGSLGFMLAIYWPLALIVAAFMPIMVLFSATKRIKMRDSFAESRAEIAEVNAGLENSISGIRVSKAYTSRAFENEHFAEGNARFVKARAHAMQAMGEFSSGNTFFGDLLQLVLYVAGGLFCYYGKIDVPEFTAFLLYINMFMNPVRRLVGFIEQYQNGMTGFKRFTDIIDEKPETDKPDAAVLENVRGEIEFNNVSFRYSDEGRQILSGLSFKVAAGRTLALVGESGGGKTTICHLIPRFYPLEEGSITIDGTDIRDVTMESLRSKVGIVAQDVFLFNASVYENIAYGIPNVTREQVEEAARRANIHEYVMSLPDGYDTVVGERGVKLSGGQKQRISIARVFLKNPPILILDEATSALDNVTEQMIQKSLSELSVGRTTIVVAHRLTTVKNADEIIVVSREGIVERGTHDELLENDGVYAGLWKTSMQIEPTLKD
ncbi:MAG: ABC transporter ATP-binding protein/permease [Clostridia bacterium]|nr:ABC transporter ATP-binding protein/permease [Clostridia bacterium]